ncbi:MAG: NAD(+) synthase, partial [Chloroflexota bacterium]
DAVFRARLHDSRRRKEKLHAGDAARRVVLAPLPEAAAPPLTAREVAPVTPVDEIYRALVLGTRDYVRKNGFKRVVIGLSGGIDSSLTCCVAVDALGKRNVVGVGMPSRYSSEGSGTDARALADALGVRFMVIPIEQAFTAYLETLSEPFSGTQPNVAEENIQARIRGNILMALSNKFGWLVLSTGNKSELSIGYSTLYGDMAGGFSVLKVVPKTLAYKLAAWRNAHPSREGRGPIPKSVLAKPPSPELRADQKTEEERVPYRIMDPILKAYVEEDRTFEDIVGMGNDAETVQRVLRWVDKNEYKRRQAPPGVKITPRAFGRDRRMPITNGYQKA